MKTATKPFRFLTLLSSLIVVAILSASAALYGQSLFQFGPSNASSNAVGRGDIPPLQSDAAIRPTSTTDRVVAQQAAQNDVSARLAELMPEERVAVQLYAGRNKSIVNVSTLETRRHFFTQEISEGCGSGVVLNKQGVILTNFHVVRDTSKITLFAAKRTKTMAPTRIPTWRSLRSTRLRTSSRRVRGLSELP